MVLKYLIVVFLVLQASNGVIYHLNDTEHARLPALFELDRYDSCLRGPGDRYCTLLLELSANGPNKYLTFIQKYSNHYTKHFNYSRIERGICVRKRCQKFLKNQQLGTTEDLEATLAECMNDTTWNEYGLQSRIQSYTCDKYNEKLENDVYDWIVLFLILTLVGLNVIGSIYDLVESSRTYETNHNYGFKYYLLCFSIFQNWNWLVSYVPDEPRLQKLKGLNCVKCIVMFLFVIGHVFYMFHGFTENPHQVEKYYEYTFYRILFNGLVSVQILFAISGFLLAYNLLIRAEKQPITWKLVPKIVLLRLWRLTPANAVFVLFSATWLRHLGSGPLWTSFVGSKMAGQCRTYWWSHLLYVNNYISSNRFCVVPNWQLAADVQLFILGLCVVAGAGNRRVLVLGLLGLLGAAAGALHVWWEDLDPFLMLTPETYRTFDARTFEVHKYTHVNIPGFVIGMLTAHVAYYCQKNNVDFSRYKWLLFKVSHCVVPLIALVFYSGCYFYEQPRELVPRLVYAAALRPTVAALTAYIVLGMIMGFSESWLKFLSWDGWVVPSRLTYSVSLLHTALIILLHGTRTQLAHVSTFNHTLMYLGIGAMSFLMAVPYHLLFEAPLNRLMKKIIARDTIHQVKKVE